MGQVHFLALLLGFGLDRLLGDPLWLPHPVVAIGKLIAWLEKKLRVRFGAGAESEQKAGVLAVALVIACAYMIPAVALASAYRLGPTVAVAVEAWFFYQLLAARSLRDAGMDVYRHLRNHDIAAARRSVGKIVGRDTNSLDPGEIARAAVETVAENSSDGVIAPMLYFALGGLPLAFVYKAINTMDSMVGYKNEKYLHFGAAAARMDDIANFIPARLTAWLAVLSARLLKLDWKRTLLVYYQYRKAHSSPNAGHPEAAFAGTLGVRLGGDSLYGGMLVHKPIINPRGRECIAEDIARASRIMYFVSCLALLVCVIILWSFGGGGSGAWN